MGWFDHQHPALVYTPVRLRRAFCEDDQILVSV